MTLPENIDVTYPDRSPGDAAHQGHHDIIHTIINGFGLVVRSVDDLADYQVGDEITLPTGLVLFLGTVDLGSAYLVPSAGTIIRGLSDAVVLSTTTGGVIRCTNHAANLIIREVNIVCLTGPCVALDGNIDYQLNMFFVGLLGASAGTISGWNVQSVKQCYINAADGFTFDGTTRKVFVSETPFYGVTGSAMRLASTLSAQVVDIVTSFFKFDAPGVCLEAEAGYTISTGNLRGSLRDGTATPLVGLAPSDIEWTMTNNTGVADSRVVGVLSIATTAVTNIVTQSVPVKVAGTTVPWPINERFTHSAGRLTYSGVEPVTADADVAFAVDPAANNQVLSVTIAINGVPFEESESRVRVAGGGDERSGSVTGIFQLTQGDYVEVFIANETSTADVTVLSMTLKVRA